MCQTNEVIFWFFDGKGFNTATRRHEETTAKASEVEKGMLGCWDEGFK